MNEESCYLRQNVQVEPLIDCWYTWSHLIPPFTAARNITERHLRLMDSYISAPQIHANATKNPKFLGGPFIDLGGGRVDEIKTLREETRARRESLIALSAAISELDQLLRSTAKGLSLEPLYSKIPKALRGYVELVYDLNNAPSFRIIEPLVYRSSYYDRSAQTMMLSPITGDERPFILSTPRLSSDDTVHLEIAF